MSTASCPKLDLGPTFGAFLLATFVVSTLYGLITHQTYRYYRLYPQDRIWFKFFVATLWSLDSVHTAFSIQFCYFYLVANYSNPLALLDGTRTFQMAFLLGAMVAFLTNSFYAWRLHILGKGNIILTGVTVGLTVVRLGFGFAAVTEGIIAKKFASLEDSHTYSWLAHAAFSSATAADTVIAIAMTLCLYRRKTGHERTNSKVDVLIMYTINTGLVTSCISITSLILSFIAPGNLIYLAFNSVLGKFYTNSVLAVFNSRQSLQDRNTEFFVPGAFGLESPTPEIPLSRALSRSNQRVEKKLFENIKSPAINIAITRDEGRKDELWNIRANRSIRNSASDITLAARKI